MFFNKSTLIFVVLFACSCSSKKSKPAITWLYGYGQVEKLNGQVKKLSEKDFAYTFNNKGDIIMIENLFKNGNDTTSYTTTYNNSGKKTQAVGLYFDSGKKIREVYIYDDNELLIDCINNTFHPNPDTDRFLYDNEGNLIEHQQYFQKKPLWIFKYRYFYNKNSICVGVEQSMTTWRDSFKKAEKDTTHYISFDSKNNWIKAVNFLKDTIKRKITYY